MPHCNAAKIDLKRPPRRFGRLTRPDAFAALKNAVTVP
jgi:hypothetical protein